MLGVSRVLDDRIRQRQHSLQVPILALHRRGKIVSEWLRWLRARNRRAHHTELRSHAHWPSARVLHRRHARFLSSFF